MQFKKISITNSEEIGQYIKDIKKIPVITHERQEEIFTKLNNEKTKKSERTKLLEELVLGNLRFVISISKSYQNQGLELLDLISEGNIGLIKAAEKFDTTSGLRFISYAVWWIRQSMMSALNDYSRTIRIPSNVIQDSNKSKKDGERQQDNFVVTDDEVFNASLPRCISLSNVINDEGDELIDVIINPNINVYEKIFNTKSDMKNRVASMLSVLDEREKIIIDKSFGLSGVQSNLDDLGEEFQCTKERVRQLRDRSIQKLRNVADQLFDLM
jgi:RNA polymerase primary sigma factor